MGLWSQSAGVWTLAGDGARTAVVSQTPAVGNYALRWQFKNPANLGGGTFKSSPDGRTCYQVDTDAGTGGNLQIRLVTFGVPGPVLASAAHGLTTSIPYTLEVRWEQGVVKVRVNGLATDLFTYTPAADALQNHDYWGFEGTVDQMKVLDAEIAELIQQQAERADVLVAMAGGEFWQCEDGENLERCGTAPVMKAFGDVDMCEFEQKAIAVDGANLRELDVATKVVSRITVTAGLLPGASTTTDGKCSATIIERTIGRVALAGMKDDPQNLFECAPNDRTDWDTGVFPVGTGAFGLTAADAAKVGEPIRGLLGVSRQSVLIACQRSFWELRGDPAIGAAGVDEIVKGIGVTGKDAMVMIDTGRVAAHSQTGLILVPGAGGAPAYLSQGILTDYIQLIDGLENYHCILVRNPLRQGTHIFLTKRTSGPSVHFWYDERVGQWSEGRVVDGQVVAHPGGFFPETYPDRVGPTAAVYWNGKVILGGRDGYLYEFDETGVLDTDDGDAINWTMAMGLMVDPDIDADTEVHRLVFQTADDCDAFNVKVYGGVTAEEAYGGANRWLVLSRTRPAGERVSRWDQRFRAPALVCELSGTGWFDLEAAQAVRTACALTARRRTPVAAGAAVAPVPFVAVPPAWGASFVLPSGWWEDDELDAWSAAVGATVMTSGGSGAVVAEF